MKYSLQCTGSEPLDNGNSNADTVNSMGYVDESTLNSEVKNQSEIIIPPATIGIIGGGQLGRMMAIAAKYHGFEVALLDPTPYCPLAQVIGDNAQRHVVAEYDDVKALTRLAKISDVLTYEFENVDAQALSIVKGQVRIPQGVQLLRVTQDRVHEKQWINDCGILTADWRQIDSEKDAWVAVEQLQYPVVLKTRTGGYDGHGQAIIHSSRELGEVLQRWYHNDLFIPSVMEKIVNFAYEASILVSGNGYQYVTFPMVKNIHKHNILHMTIAPKNHVAFQQVEHRARNLALKLAERFRLAGTLAIELFVEYDGTVRVNELAPRPHNSGHYTIEACSINQFDAHIRGIAGWQLPQPQLLSSAVMVNVLGQHLEKVRQIAAKKPHWFIHDYGKIDIEHNRKMGHITVLTDDIDSTVDEFNSTGIWEEE